MPAGRGVAYPVVRYDSTSERLTRDVQSLLLRLGILASRRALSMGAKGRASHRLTVSGQGDVERFIELVGGAGARNAAACSAIGEQVRGTTASTNRDTSRAASRSVVGPPIGPAAVASPDLQQALGSSDCWTAPGQGGPSRERVGLVAGTPAAEGLAAPATSEVYWDEVVTVEPDGIEEVYDLTVDGLHNFVAEDVIVHNSIEQDADLVMFVYRDEYYNPEETDSAGVAEINLAKHRNGATDTTKLAFQKRYAKFADLAAGA